MSETEQTETPSQAVAEALLAQADRTSRLEAARVAGGEEKLRALIQEAYVFVPALEREDMNRCLADPSRRVYAVQALIGDQQKFRESQKFVHPPKTIREYQALSRRAVDGDKAAQAIVMTINPSTLTT